MAGQTFKDFDVRGDTIRYLRAGEGKPLLLLRGNDASDGWRDYMSKLSEHFDVIVPEHPGLGGADKPAWLDNAADLAHFYFDFIDAFGVENAHVVGHDFGGWIAAEMAIRDTRKMSSLTLIAAAGLYLADAVGEDPFLRNEEEAITDQFFDSKMVDAECARLLTDETEDVRIANQMVIAQIAWTPRWHNPHLRKWLHQIDIPVQIIWGQQDKVTPVAHGHEWNNLIAGSELNVLESCGHVPLLEQTNACIEMIVQSLAKEVRVS